MNQFLLPLFVSPLDVKHAQAQERGGKNVILEARPYPDARTTTHHEGSAKSSHLAYRIIMASFLHREAFRYKQPMLHTRRLLIKTRLNN
jgi:hypothetical protein